MENKCKLPSPEKAGAARSIVAEMFKNADTEPTGTAFNATTNAVARVPEDPNQIELVSFPIETTTKDSNIPINLDGNNVIYTEEQTEAINRMKQFVSSVFKNEIEEKDIVKGFLLTGSAGTGKTTILKGLVEAIDDANITDGITVVASAVSGLATGNLFSKINKANTPNGRVQNVIAKTVYALFGSAGATEQSKYNRSNNGDNTKLAELESKIYTSNVIILLDEASMLDDDTLDGLQNIIKKAREVDRKVCIIYSGDLAQISPIKEGEEEKKKNKNIITKCSLFIKGKGDVKYIRGGASLTKVIRQGESSPILDYATNIAKLSTLADTNTNVLTSYNRRNSIISPTGALLIMKNSGGMEYIMPAFIHARDNNSPLYVKYITYTNAKVKEVNTKIVESLFPDIQENDLYAAKDEWFLLYKIYEDIANATPFKIKENLPNKTPESRNKEEWKSFKMKSALKDVANLDHILNGIQLPSDVNFNMLDEQFHIYKTKVDVYTAEGEIVSKIFYYLPEDQMERFLKTAYLLKTAIISILNNRNNFYLRGSLWRAYYNIFSKTFNTPEAPNGGSIEAYVEKGLKSAGALPFYAITTHKAQGCTFEICAFDKDSYNSGNLNIVETAEMMYVALTRAANVSIMLTDSSINSDYKEELIGLNQTISGNRNSISATLFPYAEDAEILEESNTDNSSSNTINIYAGTGENADLSNFANRPFTINLLGKDIKVNSVEHAFQLSKLYEVFDELEEDTFNKWETDILSATSAKAKELGRAIPLTKAALNSWNEKSSEVMRDLIKKSFEQNPEALQKLLATGNAELTHNQGTGKWRTEFPELLMDVRKELRENKDNTTSTSDNSSTEPVMFLAKDVKSLNGKVEENNVLQYSNTAFIFTDNAQASDAAHPELREVLPNTWIGENYKKEEDVLINVGNSTARIRTFGNIVLPNAFGLVVKKYQQKKGETKFLTKEGQFEDNNTDFELFKAYNNNVISRIKSMPKYGIIIASEEIALTRAALPKRFAEWLKDRLEKELGIISSIEENTKKEYEGYGLRINSFVSGKEGILIKENENLKGVTNHSGGALGSDSYWGDLGRLYGVKSNHYYYKNRTPKGNINQEEAEYLEGVEKAKQAAETMHRSMNDKFLNLLARNWSQVKHSDAIFAIGTIVRQGEKNAKGYDVKATQVDGGTGYAVQMAINTIGADGNSARKPVFVFDQKTNKWYIYDYSANDFIETETPRLTKNFAGIGTRQLYSNGMKAIADVYEKTDKEGLLKIENVPLRNDANQALEGFNLALQKESLDNIKKQIKELKEGKSIQEFITGKNPFFSTNEIKAIEGAIGKKGSKNSNGLHVVSLDRQTDAVLFAKEVIEKLKENAKLRFGDPNRFYAVELWSKHDGQAMFDILEACKKYRVAPMVQFTVTGFGNTAIEPGVKKWEDLMGDIKSLIESGILDPNTTCIRIDPIIPGVTNWDTVADIISKSKELGISKFISSLLNSYENLKERGVKENVTSALKEMGIDYNWDTYYNPNAALPKEEVKRAYYESLEALQEALGVTIKVCAGGVENSKTNLIPAACLDPDLIETVTGINVKDANGNYVKDKLRPNEHCYGNRSNLLGQKYPCYSNCAFCYAAKGGMENVLRYYNKDGELDLNNSEIKYLSKMQKLEDKINNGITMLKNVGMPLKFKNVVSNEIVNLLNNSNKPIPYDKEITSVEMAIEVQKNLDIISASIKAASNGNIDIALKYTSIAYTNINNVLEGKKADYKEFSGVNFASSTHSAYTNVMNTVLRKKAQSIDNIKTNEIEKSQLAELYSNMTPEEVDNATTAISEYIQRILKKELKKAIEDVEKSIINSNSELEKAKKRKLLNLLNNDKTKWAALTKIIELSKIIDKTKESFKLSEEHRKFFGEDAKYHDNVYNNFEVLFKEAKGKIEESLEIRIVEQEVKEKEEKIEESNANEFDENMDSMTNNTVLFKIRHLDSIKTATSKSKEFLSRIRKYDRNGKPENLKGFVNIPSMHNMVELFITLEYEFNNHVISSEDFAIYSNETGSYSFPLFDKIRGKYSWIKTIEENINKSDEKHDIVASLFGDLRKDKIDYVTYKKDFKTGEMRKIEMSKSSILDSAVTTITRSAREGKIKYLNTDLTFRKTEDIARDKASIHIDSSIENLRNICIQYLGNTEINITEDNKEKVKNALLSYINNIVKAKDGMSWEEFIDNREHRKALNIIANTVSTINQVSTDVTFYHNGNTYQSFRNPSEVVQKIKLLNRKESREVTIEAYRKDPFYKNSHLLTHMEKYEDFNIEYQEMFEFNGKEYAELNDLDIDCILLYQFYSNIKSTYYRMPLHSDSEFISFLKLPVYRTFEDNEMNTLKDGIKSVIKQELQRMSNIQNRRQNENIKPIDYYDEQANTSKFHYFPILNNTKFLERIKSLKYNFNIDEYNKLLDRAVDVILEELQKKAIAKVENEDFVNEFYNIVKNSEAFKNIISKYRTNNTLEAKAKARKEALAILYYNYLVNNALAQTQILTLFYGDVAFYKNNVEVQKRGKQLIASGRRPFTGRPDIDGKLSSKVDKVITLKDKIRPSRSYSKIAKILGKEKASNFLRVNSTDAQAFRTLPSYVKIMKSWGFWNTKVDDAIVNRIIQGEANMEDFNIMYQTLKPFVYGLVEKFNVNAKGEETSLLVPKQHKDSEMVLLAIYKHLDSVLNGDSALKGLNDFMVSKGIDVAIFESGVKEGNQGGIDINYSRDKLKKQVKDNGEAFEDIDDYLDYYITKLKNEKITQEEFSAAMDMIEPSAEEVKKFLEKEIADSTLAAQVIHEVPLDNYMKAQDNPEHLMDTTCIYGTQLNVLAVSDLPMNDPEFEVKIGNKKISAKEALELYNNIRTEKFILGYEKAKEWFSSKKKLKEKLESLIKTNSNYNIRLLDALSLVEVGSFDKRDDFNTPINMPNMIHSLSGMMLSIFKNNVTRHEYKGGTATLATDWGLFDSKTHKSGAPEIVFDSEGNLEAVECYLPATSEKMFAAFLEEKIDANGKTYYILNAENMDEGLRMCLGYRIPTENKYSMLPLRIKGFLPQQCGGSIILPADITTIAGSDFDIDKAFILLPEFKIKNKINWKELHKDFRKAFPELIKEENREINNYLVKEIKKAINEKAGGRYVKNYKEVFKASLEDARKNNTKKALRGVLSEDLKLRIKDALDAFIYENKNKYKETPTLTRVTADLTKDPSTWTEAERHNTLLELLNNIITHPKMQKNFLSPGNADALGIGGKVVSIVNSKETISALKEEHDSIEDIISILENPKKLSEIKIKEEEPSIISDENFKKYHKQNMTGASLISNYAVSSVSHSKMNYLNKKLNPYYVIKIDGKELSVLDPTYDTQNTLVSSNTATGISAAVDNAKDQKLAKVLQSPKTSNVFEASNRLGIPIKTYIYAVSHPLVYESFMTTGDFSKVQSIVSGLEEDLKEHYDKCVEFSSKTFIEAALNYQEGKLTKSDVEVFKFINHLSEVGEQLTDLSLNTRQDSVNGGIASTLAGAILQVIKVRLMNQNINIIENVEDLVKENLLDSKDSTESIRAKLRESELPQVQAGYTLGIEQALKEISKYTELASSEMIEMIEFICSQSGRYTVSEKIVTSFLYDFLYDTIIRSLQEKGVDYISSRSYYLEEFPKFFMSNIKTNKKFNNLKIIKLINFNKGELQCVINNKNKNLKAQLERELDSLVMSGDEDSIKLAKDLLMYSLYKDGLAWGATSYATLFTPSFINSFSDLFEDLRDLKVDDVAKNNEFIRKFYYNHFHEYGILPQIDVEGELGIKHYSTVTTELPHTQFKVLFDNKTKQVSLLQLKEHYSDSKEAIYENLNIVKNRYDKSYLFYGDVEDYKDNISVVETEVEIEKLEKLTKTNLDTYTSILDKYRKQGEENNNFCKK
jgi:predicted NAD-dependent protein-ADP-ribosyltransferase YbiA (DUF1768 family)